MVNDRLNLDYIAKQKGSALLTALFIMTLVAIAATAMSTRLQFDIYRVNITNKSDALYLSSQAVTFWSMGVLSEKKIDFSYKAKNGLIARFPKKQQSMYPQIIITGELYDLQARFNLNTIREKKYRALFVNLLNNLLNDNTSQEHKNHIEAISHWITAYLPDRGADDFINYYSQQNPAYLPGFQSMKNISELRLVKTINEQIYNTLLPYVVTLPELTPININTASDLILKSFSNSLNESQLNELITKRQEKPFTDANELNNLLTRLEIPTNLVTTESNYFLCIARVATNDLSLSTYTILKRSKDNKGNYSVSMISQSLNTQ